MLVLALVLLGDARSSAGAVTADNCDSAIGVCSACITADSSKPYWDGESCVSCAAGTDSSNPYFNSESKTCVTSCPLTYDENNVCRTCAELDENTPFWNGSACVAACPETWYVSEDDTKCVRACAYWMWVDDHGFLHQQCTKYGCINHGYEYKETESAREICVSASVCTNHYGRNAYTKVSKCISALPKDENEFKISNGVYTCKSGYVFIDGETTQCYSRETCPGYIYWSRECVKRETCQNYFYEDKSGNDCL